ncbi:MAG: GNAT family N-acetyltransferase [Leadbetterella sp.]|nr:GNAT family N-acetyltransferase [Leadbetterella sp.]
MYASLVKPDTLAPRELDLFLEKGWFRLGTGLFTTSFLTFEDTLFDTFWLRVNLSEFQPSRSQREILKKISGLRVTAGRAVLTEEKEVLFGKYRESVSFQPAKNLAGLLSDPGALFDTQEVCIYDGERLVACGIFDLGESSAEGIVSFFDPDYRRLSPGKALVLHKIMFCKERGVKWFYPGYVVPGYPRFDYKLDISREDSEYYDITMSEWRDIRELEVKTQPLSRMVTALIHLEGLLHSFGFEQFRLMKYRFYDIMLDPVYKEYNLLTYPYFIHCFANSSLEEVVIVFDTFTMSYKLLVCHKMFQISFPPEGDDYFSTFLLREAKVVFQEKNPFNFMFGLHEILKRRTPTDVMREQEK